MDLPPVRSGFPSDAEDGCHAVLLAVWGVRGPPVHVQCAEAVLGGRRVIDDALREGAMRVAAGLDAVAAHHASMTSRNEGAGGMMLCTVAWDLDCVSAEPGGLRS
jgi:hypothetical protein